MLSAKQGSGEYHFFKSFDVTRLGEMNPRFTDSEADAQTTTQSLGVLSTVIIIPTNEDLIDSLYYMILSRTKPTEGYSYVGPFYSFGVQMKS